MHKERHVAISVLIEINQGGAYNNIALRRVLGTNQCWQPHQKAFVTELVNGTLRNQILIDHIIDGFSRSTSYKIKPFIRELLRTAVYQIIWMDKVPPSAAVNEAVKLAKSCGFGSLSGFVNGILRNIVRGYEKGSVPIPLKGKVDAQYLSLKYSFPLWLALALIDWMGEQGAEEFCAQSHKPPSVTVCANPLKTSRDILAAKLEALGVECVKSTLTDSCLHLKKVSDITSTEIYKQGHFFVIDEGAYLAAYTLSPGQHKGQNIIDLCAAPGGKSFVCAGQMNNTGQIISCDIHPHKIRLMEDMAHRLGMDCIKVQKRDASVINPEWKEWADAVILDPPCSGFGVIRKKPDVKYTKTMEDVRSLAKFQQLLLSVAAAYVKPGGVLVYSTCTITREENQDNVRWFLNNFPFAVEEPNLPLLPKDSGFFVVRLKKCK